MTFVRDKGACDQAAAMSRGRDQCHFWNHLGTHVTQTHALAAQDTNLFQACLEFLVGIEFGWGLVACFSDVSRAQYHHRHAVVDEGRFNSFDLVQCPARWQQRATYRTLGFEKVDPDGGGTARHTGNTSVSLIANLSARGGYMGDCYVGSVDHVNGHRGNWIPGSDQSPFDRKGTNASQHVAAVGGNVNERSVDRDLGEEVVDVNSRARGE